MATEKEWKNVVEEAEETCKEFCEKYYEVMDQKRHQTVKLYSNDAVMVYEGNRVETSANIGQFYENLPSSTHKVTTLDAQPVSTKMLNGIQSVLISASGTVKWLVTGARPVHKSFTQHFILSLIQGSDKPQWLIVSDTVRLCNSEYKPRN